MSHATLRMLPISEVVRQGSCNRFCGVCCSVTRWKQHPLWGEKIKPLFDELGENDRGDCAKLVWKNGMATCSIYETRPQVCRDFPNHPLSIEIIPECAFTFRSVEHVEAVRPHDEPVAEVGVNARVE